MGPVHVEEMYHLDPPGSCSVKQSAPLCQSLGKWHLGPEADGCVDWINTREPLEPLLWIKREANGDLLGWTEPKGLASALMLQLIAVCPEPSYHASPGLV